MKTWGLKADNEDAIARHMLSLRIAQLGEMKKSGTLAAAKRFVAEKAQGTTTSSVKKELELIQDLDDLIQKYSFFFYH